MSEFKKYWEEYESNNHVLGSEEYCAKLAWNARQSEIDQLKAEKAKLGETIQDALKVITSKIGDCRITENSQNLANWQQNTAFLIREELQVLEEALRGDDQNTKNSIQAIESNGNRGGDQKERGES